VRCAPELSRGQQAFAFSSSQVVKALLPLLVNPVMKEPFLVRVGVAFLDMPGAYSNGLSPFWKKLEAAFAAGPPSS